jgi:hypothetical protein
VPFIARKRLVDYSIKSALFADLHPLVSSALTETHPELLDGRPLSTFVHDAVLQVQKDVLTPLPRRVAVAKAMVLTSTGTVADAAQMIVKHGLQVRSVSLDTCREAYEALRSFGDEANNAAVQWRSVVCERFKAF